VKGTVPKTKHFSSNFSPILVLLFVIKIFKNYKISTITKTIKKIISKAIKNLNTVKGGDSELRKNGATIGEGGH